MKRIDLLKAAATLPVMGALLPRFVAVEPEAEAETFQFARIDNGHNILEITEHLPGRASVQQIGEAVGRGFNYVWQFVRVNGIREVHGVTIGR